MAYLQTCPNCGQQLTPVTVGPDSAPWACPPCHLSFWVCELEQRQVWVPSQLCFGHPGRAGRDTAIAGEQAAAAERGTSTLPEHLSLLPASQLQAVARIAGHTPFAAQITAAAKARGGT